MRQATEVAPNSKTQTQTEQIFDAEDKIFVMRQATEDALKAKTQALTQRIVTQRILEEENKIRGMRIQEKRDLHK